MGRNIKVRLLYYGKRPIVKRNNDENQHMQVQLRSVVFTIRLFNYFRSIRILNWRRYECIYHTQKCH